MNDEWKLELRLIFVFCAVLLLGILYFYGVGNMRLQNQVIASKISQLPASFSDYSPSAKSIFVYAPKRGHMLFAHHEYSVRPLASLSKIMTATVALEKMEPNEKITINEEAYASYGDNGLVLNETWPLIDLLKFTLFVSSNDGATAIAQVYDTKYLNNEPINNTTFVSQMNTRAQEMSLNSLSFKNPSGLDVDGQASGLGNARDIGMLFYTLYLEYPDIVKDSSMFTQTYTSIDGLVHKALNTNILLEKDYDRIIGSKTGYTSQAGGNLVVLLDTPLGEPVVLVVLGSSIDGRFQEMNTLLARTREFTNSLYSLGLTFQNLK